MPQDTWPPQCSLCSKFISYADMEAGQTLQWTPYGSYMDTEPPSDEWAHRRCYEQADEPSRRLIARTAWHGPA